MNSSIEAAAFGLGGVAALDASRRVGDLLWPDNPWASGAGAIALLTGGSALVVEVLGLTGGTTAPRLLVTLLLLWGLAIAGTEGHAWDGSPGPRWASLGRVVVTPGFALLVVSASGRPALAPFAHPARWESGLAVLAVAMAISAAGLLAWGVTGRSGVATAFTLATCVAAAGAVVVLGARAHQLLAAGALVAITAFALPAWRSPSRANLAMVCIAGGLAIGAEPLTAVPVLASIAVLVVAAATRLPASRSFIAACARSTAIAALVCACLLPGGALAWSWPR